MTDTVKLIIEIPKEIYKEALKSGYSHLYDEDVANAVAEGIPLDDVKSEIANIETYERDGCWVMADVWKVLNNIEQEVKHD